MAEEVLKKKRMGKKKTVLVQGRTMHVLFEVCHARLEWGRMGAWTTERAWVEVLVCKEQQRVACETSSNIVV